MEIDGGFDLLAPEASNYLLIAHAKVCVGKLGCDLNTSADTSTSVREIHIYQYLMFLFGFFLFLDALTVYSFSQMSIFVSDSTQGEKSHIISLYSSHKTENATS